MKTLLKYGGYILDAIGFALFVFVIWALLTAQAAIMGAI